MNVRQAEDSCSHRANGRNEAKATKERKEHKEFEGKKQWLEHSRYPTNLLKHLILQEMF